MRKNLRENCCHFKTNKEKKGIFFSKKNKDVPGSPTWCTIFSSDNIWNFLGVFKRENGKEIEKERERERAVNWILENMKGNLDENPKIFHSGPNFILFPTFRIIDLFSNSLDSLNMKEREREREKKSKKICFNFFFTKNLFILFHYWSLDTVDFIYFANNNFFFFYLLVVTQFSWYVCLFVYRLNIDFRFFISFYFYFIQYWL